MKKIMIRTLIGLLFCMPEVFAKLPNFINIDELKNAKFICRNKEASYSPQERKQLNQLWQETLIYLNTFADALSTSSNGRCKDSDEAIIQTGNMKSSEPIRQCITDNEDVQKLIKHLYIIINNQDRAFKCFNPQKKVNGLYSPSDKLIKQSSVAKWLNRPTLKTYYQSNYNTQIQKKGIEYTDKFYQVTTDEAIKMPQNFKQDISARGLPNLWASAGWVPMYSTNSERNINAGDINFRAGYAYAEIMGHWGLLQIDSINDESVGAEIGMTVQSGNTFYPYHHHDTNEIYYTIRKAACTKGITQFVVDPKHDPFMVLSSTNNKLVVELNGNRSKNIDNYWIETSPNKDALLYIPRNSIHAFNLKANNCGENYAHVTIWARTNADEKNDDYGTTNICRLKDKDLDKNKINQMTPNIICNLNQSHLNK